MEESKTDKTGQFVTLTFSEEALRKVEEQAGTNEANTVAKTAVRLFRWRWKKKYGKSIKHWIIPELGHKNTERLHLHGILYTDKTKEEISERWQYGKVDVGYSMNEKVINYVVKYITKEDKDHKGFRGRVLPSPGLGKGFMERSDWKQNKFKGEKTDETYKLNNGQKIGLPKYYKNKIYSDEEKEKLWMQKVDKNEIYVMGQKIKNIDTKEGQRVVEAALRYARKESRSLGYGDGSGKKEFATKKNQDKIWTIKK